MARRKSEQDILFEVKTPIDLLVRVTYSYWELIATVKHPVMDGKVVEVQGTLEWPDEIRQSKRDAAVFLFYKETGNGRWICAVVKSLNGEGFLVTTYPTDSIKEGVSIWHK